MHFNPEINLGTIIEICTFFFTVLAFGIGAIRKFDKIEAKLNIMYGWFEESVLHARPVKDTRDFFGKRE
jgi:hypothetical protein